MKEVDWILKQFTGMNDGKHHHVMYTLNIGTNTPIPLLTKMQSTSKKNACNNKHSSHPWLHQLYDVLFGRKN